MKKTTILVFLLAIVTSSMQAIVVQRVHLKNGSVLNGYIQMQDTLGRITFHTESAEVYVPGDMVTQLQNHTYSVSELTQAWIDWAEKNNAFEGSGNGRTLTLCDISFKQEGLSVTGVDSVAIDDQSTQSLQYKTATKVRLLETGANMRYVELTPNVYEFYWSDVNYIDADRPDKSLLSGIERTYVMHDGRQVKGQYAGETENTLSLYVSGGIKETFDLLSVDKYLYTKTNPNQPLREQSPLLDEIRMKKGGTYEGVIVERDFTAGNNCITIEITPDNKQTVKMADIAWLASKENPDYKPKTDVVLNIGEMMINRILADSVNVRQEGDRMVLDSIGNKVVLPAGTTTVALEYCNPGQSPNKLMLVKLKKQTLVMKKKSVVTYGFTNNILTLVPISPKSTETSPNNTTRVEYELQGAGVYAFYDNYLKRAMPFTVKK